MLAPLLVFALFGLAHASDQKECSERSVLKSYFGQYLRATQWSGDAVIGDDGPTDNAGELYIEYRGEKILLKTLYGPRYLRAYPNGSVDLAELPLDWEEFHPFKNADNSWSLKTHHGRWLSVNANGTVSTVTQRKGLEHFWFKTKTACHWTIFNRNTTLANKMAGHRILKTAHKTYLRAVDYEGANNTVNLAYAAKEAEHWLVETRGTRVALKSSRGNYLHTYINGTVNVIDNDFFEATWKPTQNADGTWRLQSDHGRWLSAGEDGTVSTVEYHGPWENFVLEDWY